MEESRKNRKADFVRNESYRARSRSSDGSGSVVLPSRSYDGPKKVKEDEVDFYDSPTTLSRLILHQKYDSAIRRLEKAPHEASTWVSAIRAPDCDDDQSMKTSITINSSVQFSFRQLPLHMACGELARVKDNVLRGHVEQLIKKLITAYPQASTKKDHDNKLPLHEALWHNASPQTVSMLLMTYPEAVDEEDIFGRTSLQIIQNRRGGNEEHKETIEKLLLRGCSFWDLARKETNLKMKHKRIPSAGASVSSQSVLNDSQADTDDYTIATRESIAVRSGSGGNHQHLRHSTKVANPRAKTKKAPIAWVQLELRAQKLEYMLAEHNEENFKMAEEINRLKEIEAKYEKLTSSDIIARQVVQLEKENTELMKTVNDLKGILQRNDITNEEMTQYTKPLEIIVGKMSSAMSVSESVNKSVKSRNSSQLSSHGASKVPSSISLGSSQSVKSCLVKEGTRSLSRESARDDTSTLSGFSKRSGDWSARVNGAEPFPVPKEAAKTEISFMPPVSSSPRKPPHAEAKYMDHQNNIFVSQPSPETPSLEARRSLDGATVLETPASSTSANLPSSTPAFMIDDSAAYTSQRNGGKPLIGDMRFHRVEQQAHSLERNTAAFDSSTLCVDSLEVIPEAAVMVPSKESAEVARLRKERENLQSLVKDLVRDLNKKRVKRQTKNKGGKGETEANVGTSVGRFDAYRSLLTRSPTKSPSTSPVPVSTHSASIAMDDPLKDYQSSLQRDSDSVSHRSKSSVSKVLNSF